MPTVIANARTFLFVPGDRPDRFEKAFASGADACVLDLEDAVGPDQKPQARAAIASFMERPRSDGGAILVRINAAATELGRADRAWLAHTPGIDAVLIPKAESAEEMRQVASGLPHLPVVALIETAKGYWNLRDIARAPNVARLAFGHLDFMADTGIRCSDDEVELNAARFAITLASRDAGLAPPIDGVTTAIQDDDKLERDTARALRFGFLGKLCIHPRQVAVVHGALAPSADEVAWAQRVVAADRAAQGSAVQLDGRMIDAPVVLHARRTLERHHLATSA